MLLIIDVSAAIIGHIEFFKPVTYLDGYELSYLIYDSAERCKGATTEAVSPLMRYIFDMKKVNRLRLVIHPDNIASRRVAEKNGFVNEGTRAVPSIIGGSTTMLRYTRFCVKNLRLSNTARCN